MLKLHTHHLTRTDARANTMDMYLSRKKPVHSSASIARAASDLARDSLPNRESSESVSAKENNASHERSVGLGVTGATNEQKRPREANRNKQRIANKKQRTSTMTSESCSNLVEAILAAGSTEAMAVQVREMLVERDASDLKQVKNAVESLLEDTDKSGQAVSMEGARGWHRITFSDCFNDGISTSVSTTNEDMQSDEEVDSSRLSQRPPSPVQASQLSDDDEAYNDSDSAGNKSRTASSSSGSTSFNGVNGKEQQRGPPWLESTHALVTVTRIQTLDF